MRRERYRPRLADRRRLYESGDAATAGGVRLQYVDGSGRNHLIKVHELVAVLAGRDLHRRRRAVAKQAQTFEIVRRHRLLEPADAGCRKDFRLLQRELPRIRAVGVDEKLGVAADRIARGGATFAVRARIASDLHLHARNAVRDPATE